MYSSYGEGDNLAIDVSTHQLAVDQSVAWWKTVQAYEGSLDLWNMDKGSFFRCRK